MTRSPYSQFSMCIDHAKHLSIYLFLNTHLQFFPSLFCMKISTLCVSLIFPISRFSQKEEKVEIIEQLETFELFILQMAFLHFFFFTSHSLSRPSHTFCLGIFLE